MAGGTVKERVYYWALLTLSTLSKGYLLAKTWPDRGPRFNWIVSLALVVLVLGSLTWWNPYALGWFCGLGFCWIQTMGIDSESEMIRLRKALRNAGIPRESRAVFNRLDRWLLDGCLSAAGQQRLKAAALARKLPGAEASGTRARF